MSDEVKDKMLEIAKILFKNNVPIEQAKFIGNFIETQNNKLQQKENIIKEIREKIKEFCWDYEYETYSNMTSDEVKELLEILGSDKE